MIMNSFVIGVLLVSDPDTAGGSLLPGSMVVRRSLLPNHKTEIASSWSLFSDATNFLFIGMPDAFVSHDPGQSIVVLSFLLSYSTQVHAQLLRPGSCLQQCSNSVHMIGREELALKCGTGRDDETAVLSHSFLRHNPPLLRYQQHFGYCLINSHSFGILELENRILMMT
jgi:hypothetical protein